MPITLRPFAGEADLPHVGTLIRAAPEISRHVIDYPWRLASPALYTGQDAMLAVDANDPSGALAGFAAWQIAWAALDFWLAPGAPGDQAAEALFTWADERFRALDDARGRPLPYWAEARADDAERLALLARQGYTLDDDYTYVQMRRPLDEELSPVGAPAGYRIRPLAGEAEVDAYVALHRAAFASDSMTAAWRARTLWAPEYLPDLDLVAEAPDGTLAGFCVLWLAPARRLGQIEPIGVHPVHQGRGLARALMGEAFRRLRTHGAEAVLVETDSTRDPALRAYAAAGFRVAHTVLRKGRYVSAVNARPCRSAGG